MIDIFTPNERVARDYLVASRREVPLDELWVMALRRAKTGHWRNNCAKMMRTIMIKSMIQGPKIVRSSDLGRGNKALYKVERERPSLATITAARRP